ncbi:N-terminal Xaa-Pro-Lys N-methyltransferase 1-A [Anopheles marshallii]|uniref:N-terminal Xaa-Pro-Lys N-methyltransferase 1-A n=1 Tax=Anopheles marshallii TaxID=1521116 RepID=UPI00237B52AD|nr:N-terminal Xaa-Pro-Lys N-methyltransferase 1-A [Anopheles marshallii]
MASNIANHEGSATGIPIDTHSSVEPETNNDQSESDSECYAPNDLLSDSKSYYNNAKNYWSNVSPTVDGMLGGFGSISFIDIRGSELFLKHLYKQKPAPGRSRALDCGAGIGRISKNLLLPLFDHVDLVEQDEHFCQTARIELADYGTKLGTVFNEGLQDFVPEEGRYDIIWAQWVLGHLTDEDTVQFFHRCTNALARGGMIVIKENFTTSNVVDVDRTDSSVTRPLLQMKLLLKQANMRVVKEQRQTSFPKELYPVYMLALRPTIKK